MHITLKNYEIYQNFNLAIEDFSKAITINPDLAYVYFNRGLAHIQSGNKRSSIPDFKKACDLDFKWGCRAMEIVLKDIRH